MKDTTIEPGNELAVVNTAALQLAQINESEGMKQFRIACQNLNKAFHTQPVTEAIGATPDGKAKHIYISHIEMTLDELFFGLWETQNFRWQVVSNEIVGSLDLVLTHPVTREKITRTGAAAIQIMVDSFDQPSKEETNYWSKEQWADFRKRKNAWALDVNNKKQNALDTGFPKLKSECVKNAANSLGKLFGRDLNREVSDTFKPLLKPGEVIPITPELKAVIDEAELESITDLWTANKQYQSNPDFLRLLNERRELLTKKTAE